MTGFGGCLGAEPDDGDETAGSEQTEAEGWDGPAASAEEGAEESLRSGAGQSGQDDPDDSDPSPQPGGPGPGCLQCPPKELPSGEEQWHLE
jgi:hypothetical protein